MLSLHELIFSYDIVVYELFDLNIAVVVSVTLAEKFVDNLPTVIFIDSLLCKEDHHFVFVNVAVAVDVNRPELIVKFALFFCLGLGKL